MGLKIGIVGLPNVGKSTLFKALTKKRVEIANYPFATIEPNVGVVEVADLRLQKLAELSHSKKIIPAAVEFVDIAGLVKGAAEGEGLGNKFLSHIREADAIAQVVRVFEDEEIIHISARPDPRRDIEVLEYELILKDEETVGKRLETVSGDVKGRKKGAEEELEALQKIKNELDAGNLAAVFWEKENAELELKLIKDLQILTGKPIIYIFNVSEKQTQENWRPDKILLEKTEEKPWVEICAKVEAELAELSDLEKAEYLKSLGLKESGLDRLTRVGYKTLGLITFFTTGEDETRAWTVPTGSPAPRAGRAVHSDFEEKFIRAEVINWQKLLEAGSWTRAKDLGQLRTEGKEYVVQDGDVVEFKI